MALAARPLVISDLDQSGRAKKRREKMRTELSRRIEQHPAPHTCTRWPGTLRVPPCLPRHSLSSRSHLFFLPLASPHLSPSLPSYLPLSCAGRVTK